jgi:FkbM family methyltransferase
MAVERPACSDPPEIADYLWEGFGDPDGVAFDVGANVGQSLAWLLRRFRAVVAFEPAYESFEVLTRLPYPSVHVRNYAVSAEDGQATLYMIPINHEQGQLMSDSHYAFEAEARNATERVVLTRSLDSLARELLVPAFVKVDTEGHEGMILQGAARLLKLRQTDWLIEFHSETLHAECEARLADSGHSVETVRHPHYKTGSALWLNHGWLKARADS